MGIVFQFVIIVGLLGLVLWAVRLWLEGRDVIDDVDNLPGRIPGSEEVLYGSARRGNALLPAVEDRPNYEVPLEVNGREDFDTDVGDEELLRPPFEFDGRNRHQDAD